MVDELVTSGVQGNPENRKKRLTGAVFSIFPVYPAPEPETECNPVKSNPEKTRIILFRVNRIL